MERVIIFGTGVRAREILEEVKLKYYILGFVDNDPYLWGKKIDGILVYSVNQILTIAWDKILLATISKDIYDIMIKQLKEMGIGMSELITNYVRDDTSVRYVFLDKFSEICTNKLEMNDAAVAEAGVFQGEFASKINQCFPKRKLYLFDTFEGFPDKDIQMEKKYHLSEIEHTKFSITTIESEE